MRKYETRRCAVCDGKFKSLPMRKTFLCDSPNCYDIWSSGKSMDQLVREASEIPKDIPNNDLDYQEFDLEKMVERRYE